MKYTKQCSLLILSLVMITAGGCSLTGTTSQAVKDKTTTESTTSYISTTQQMETMDYPKIVYIDDVLYYGSDKICEMVPRKVADGIIETFVDKEIMPDSYNSANFGVEQGSMEYMFLEDGQLIVHFGENWYYFDKR